MLQQFAWAQKPTLPKHSSQLPHTLSPKANKHLSITPCPPGPSFEEPTRAPSDRTFGAPKTPPAALNTTHSPSLSAQGRQQDPPHHPHPDPDQPQPQKHRPAPSRRAEPAASPLLTMGSEPAPPARARLRGAGRSPAGAPRAGALPLPHSRHGGPAAGPSSAPCA